MAVFKTGEKSFFLQNSDTCKRFNVLILHDAPQPHNKKRTRTDPIQVIITHHNDKPFVCRTTRERQTLQKLTPTNKKFFTQ